MTRRRNQAAEDVLEDENRTPIGGGEPESEMMAMVRALMREQSKAEERRAEARRQEAQEREDALRAEMRREEGAREDARLRREEEAARKQAELQAENVRNQTELQAEAERRQFNQQVELLKLQAEMGERASRTHRELQSSDRRRDRALFSIPVYKEGEDIENFLSTAERRLRAAEIPQGEWIPIMDTRLSGPKAAAWQDITIATGEYVEARDKLLKVCGFTPLLAADSFFGFKLEGSRGLTADQLYQRGQQLLRRMIAPGRVTEEIEYAILRGWVGSVISKKARAAIGAREVKDAAGLISAHFLILDGEKGQ